MDEMKKVHDNESLGVTIGRNIADLSIGVLYVVASPFVGAYRGFRGDNTPLPFKQIVSQEGTTYKTALGSVLASATVLLGGTPLATPTWAAARLLRPVFIGVYKEFSEKN